MNRMERRTLLKLAAGGAAAALNFLYPGLAGLTRAAGGRGSGDRPVAGAIRTPGGIVVQRPDGLDPSVAGGEVVAKTSDGMVLQSPAAVRAVRIPSGTVVWKEFEATPDAIQLRDWVDVKGTPQADGSLQATSGWVFVNIGRRDGVVERVSPTGLVMKGKRGVATIELSARLEVISAKDGSPLPGHLTALVPGMRFGAVGLRLPNDGFRATRIWA